MKTKAAILWGLNQRWEIEEVELDGPKRDEVTVKLVASGLCHSDHHLVTGDIPRPFHASRKFQSSLPTRVWLRWFHPEFSGRTLSRQ